MLNQTARDTSKRRLRTTVCCVHVPARVAGLRRVGCRDFNKHSAHSCELVSQKFCKSTPSNCSDTASEPSADAHHVLRTQCFYDDSAVAIGIRRREAVQNMTTLTTDFSTKAHDTRLRFFSIFRSFLSSRHDTLSMRKTAHGMLVEARIFNNFAVTVGDNVHDTAIDGDDGRSSWNGSWHLKFAHDASKPLVTVLDECAGYGTEHSLVCDARKQLPNWPPRCSRTCNAFGLRAQVPAQGHHRKGLRHTARVMGVDMCRLRVRTARDRIRVRSCPSTRWLPTEGRAFDAGQFAEGRLCTNASRSVLARGRE